MTDDSWPDVSPLSVALAVDDVEASSAFYQSLGFEQTMTLPRDGGGLGVALVLDVPDVDAVYATIQEAGLDVIYDLADEFYGERVFMFVDADGYEWKVCQKTDDVPPDEVERRVTPTG